MKKAGLKEPAFKDSRSEFVVTFLNHTYSQSIEAQSEQDNRLLAFYRKPKTRKEIADFLGLSIVYWVVKNHINPLLEEGKLEMTKLDVPKSKKQKYYSLRNE